MKIKRLMSLILILTLVLGSLLPIYGSLTYAENKEGESFTEEELEILPPNLEGKILSQDELVKLHHLNEELRVIVELEDDSIDSLVKLEGNNLQGLDKKDINILQKNIEQGQDAVIKKIEKLGVSVDVKERFSLFINAFSTDVVYEDRG